MTRGHRQHATKVSSWNLEPETGGRIKGAKGGRFKQGLFIERWMREADNVGMGVWRSFRVFSSREHKGECRSYPVARPPRLPFHCLTR